MIHDFVLQRLGIAVKAALPYETGCPKCGGRLWVYGGIDVSIWLRCQDCALGGDPVGVFATLNGLDYASAAESVLIGTKMDRDQQMYLSHIFDGFTLGRANMGFVSSLLQKNWHTTGQFREELCITDDVFSNESKRGKSMLGFSNISKFRSMAMLKSVSKTLTVRSALVVPYDRQPGHIVGYSLIGKCGDSARYRRSFGHGIETASHKRLVCGGMAFLDIINPSDEYVVVMDDIVHGLRIQNEYLRCHGRPAPLVVINPDTSSEPWAYIKHKKVILLVERLSTDTIRQICKVHGSVFTHPDIDDLCNGLSSDQMLLAVAKSNAVPWYRATADYIVKLPAAVKLITGHMSSDDRARIAAYIKDEALSAMVSHAVDPAIVDPVTKVFYDRTDKTYKRQVPGGSEIACNVTISFEKTLRWENKETVYLGALELGEHRVQFKMPGSVEMGTGAKVRQFIIGTLQDAGVEDVPDLVIKYLRDVLHFAKKASLPTQQLMESHVGWSKKQRAFMFPWFSVKNGVLSVFDGTTDAKGYWDMPPSEIPVPNYSDDMQSTNARALMFILARYTLSAVSWLDRPTYLLSLSKVTKAWMRFLPKTGYYADGTDLPEVSSSRYAYGSVCLMSDRLLTFARLNGDPLIDMDPQEWALPSEGFALKFIQSFLIHYTKVSKSLAATADHDQYTIDALNSFLEHNGVRERYEHPPYKDYRVYDALQTTGRLCSDLFDDGIIDVNALTSTAKCVPGFNLELLKMMEILKTEGYDTRRRGDLISIESRRQNSASA